MFSDLWYIEPTKKLEKQLEALPKPIREIAYALLKDLEIDGPYTKTNPAQKQKKNWREFFKEELKTHSEQGLYLKGLRLREELTQADLARMIRTTQNNISAMESGLRSIGKDVAQRLAKVFHVPYQRFL